MSRAVAVRRPARARYVLAGGALVGAAAGALTSDELPPVCHSVGAAGACAGRVLQGFVEPVALAAAAGAAGALLLAAVVLLARRRAASDAPRREAIPERVRHEVWRRDRGECVDCGSRERLEFDHIIPHARGGSSTARNLELRCERCNRGKGARI